MFIASLVLSFSLLSGAGVYLYYTGAPGVIVLTSLGVLFIFISIIILIHQSRLRQITLSKELINQLRNSINEQTDRYDALLHKYQNDKKAFAKTLKEYEANKQALYNVLDDVEDKQKLLEEEREKFINAFNYSAIGFALVAPDGKWLEINQSLCSMFGYSKTELLELTFQDLTHPDDIKSDLDNVQAMLSGQIKTYQMEKRYIHKKGHIVWVLLAVSAVRNEDGSVKLFISQILDITEQKLIDNAKTEFVSLVSHQLRTPLTAIKWNLENVTDTDLESMSEDARSAFSEVHESLNGMTELVNTFLQISRLELGTFLKHPNKIHLNNVIEQILAQFKPIFDNKKLQIVFNEAKDDLITIDENAISLVIDNLLTNACKYTPSGGEITITMDSLENSIILKVKDTGVGIPENETDKIFEKMYRASNVTGTDFTGTGLGLYLVKEIITKLDATIDLQSTEGAGSTFVVTLPK